MINSFTFVVPVTDEEILKNNFLSSPLFLENKQYEIIIQRHYESAARAYNAAIEKAKSEIIIFIHQDAILPYYWIEKLEAALKYLENRDPAWGVLGCYGETKDGLSRGYLYCVGNRRYLVEPFDKPEIVHTLDEVVLIMRRSSGLKFDEALPHFHLYGTDICISAIENSMNCYAIPAFCLHNSNKISIYPEEFFTCCDIIRKKWIKYLPIYTPCVKIDHNRFAFLLKEKYLRGLKYKISNIVKHQSQESKRLDNPVKFIENMKAV
jgi:hypothetical protein